MIGAVLVWLAYFGQFQAHLTDRRSSAVRARRTRSKAADAEEGAGPVLGIFSTGPEIRNTAQNLITEIIATIVLVLAILTQGLNDDGKGLGVARRPDHRAGRRRHRPLARRPDRLRHQPGP